LFTSASPTGTDRRPEAPKRRAVAGELEGSRVGTGRTLVLVRGGSSSAEVIPRAARARAGTWSSPRWMYCDEVTWPPLVPETTTFAGPLLACG
jgi:hypothetical protein